MKRRQPAAPQDENHLDHQLASAGALLAFAMDLADGAAPCKALITCCARGSRSFTELDCALLAVARDRK
jgi:hypothetical protein